MEKKRILIISSEVWRDDINGGNVLSNLFGSFTDSFEFAQIYCNQNLPSNNVCTRYFQLSEAELIRSFFLRKSFGHELTAEEINKADEKAVVKDSPLIAVVKKLRFDVFYTIQNIMWLLSKWKTPELKKFILTFNPDIVFAPVYYGMHMHRLDRYVARLTGKKIISYIYDDIFSYRQYSLSPFFWLNRWLIHKSIIHTSKFLSLLYTMTREQLFEYQKALNVPMKVLKKTADFEQQPEFKTTLNTPLKLIYGGNLIYNRHKTLSDVVKVLKVINKNEVLAQLYIYSQTPCTPKLLKLLHDGQNSFFMGKVTTKELVEKYAGSDIVLHVESFDLKQRLLTRLSFSTKIIDLFHSARCIVAICWDGSSPYKYLRSQDAAICISRPSMIKDTLLRIIYAPSLINEYAYKAWQCGKRNHNAKEILEKFKQDLSNNEKETCFCNNHSRLLSFF